MKILFFLLLLSINFVDAAHWVPEGTALAVGNKRVGSAFQPFKPNKKPNLGDTLSFVATAGSSSSSSSSLSLAASLVSAAAAKASATQLIGAGNRGGNGLSQKEMQAQTTANSSSSSSSAAASLVSAAAAAAAAATQMPAATGSSSAGVSAPNDSPSVVAAKAHEAAACQYNFMRLEDGRYSVVRYKGEPCLPYFEDVDLKSIDELLNGIVNGTGKVFAFAQDPFKRNKTLTKEQMEKIKKEALNLNSEDPFETIADKFTVVKGCCEVWTLREALPAQYEDAIAFAAASAAAAASGVTALSASTTPPAKK